MIGYDCGSSQLDITNLFLLQVGECDLSKTQIKVEPTYIQLLQLSEFTQVKVTQRKVEVWRTVQYCGMHSHTSTVTNGESQYIKEISFDQCNMMHLTEIFIVNHNL